MLFRKPPLQGPPLSLPDGQNNNEGSFGRKSLFFLPWAGIVLRGTPGHVQSHARMLACSHARFHNCHNNNNNNNNDKNNDDNN